MKKYRNPIILLFLIALTTHLYFDVEDKGSRLKLKEVELGMSQDQVLELVGEPRSKYKDDNANFETWTFPSHPFSSHPPRCSFAISSNEVIYVFISEEEKKGLNPSQTRSLNNE